MAGAAVDEDGGGAADADADDEGGTDAGLPAALFQERLEGRADVQVPAQPCGRAVVEQAPGTGLRVMPVAPAGSQPEARRPTDRALAASRSYGCGLASSSSAAGTGSCASQAGQR